MNLSLIKLLQSNIGKPLTDDLAADICVVAGFLSTLVPLEEIAKIQPANYEEFTFAVERIKDVIEEIRPLHRAHWQETEAHRHALDLDMDYETFCHYESAGRYILFTMRAGGQLVGNCALYLDKSTHTKTLIATEDTLYLLPAVRGGQHASTFIKYMESSLKQLGVKEVCVSVKVVNKADRFFRMQGYKHVENGLTKVLEVENVQP